MEDIPGREHERLWSIAGEWATDGHVVGDPPVPVKGSDIYEVLPGGYFVVHHVDVTVGDRAGSSHRDHRGTGPRRRWIPRTVIRRPRERRSHASDSRRRRRVPLHGRPRDRFRGAASRHDDRSSALDPDGGARSSVDDGVVGTLRGRPPLGAMDEHHVHSAMTVDRLPACASWRHVQAREGFEATFFRPQETGYCIEGHTTAVEQGEVWPVRYTISLDDNWITRGARIWRWAVHGEHETRLDADGLGHWEIDGTPRAEIDGCLDVDLESSACTNMIPLRRLELGVGQTATAPAAYVRPATCTWSDSNRHTRSCTTTVDSAIPIRRRAGSVLRTNRSVHLRSPG